MEINDMEIKRLDGTIIYKDNELTLRKTFINAIQNGITDFSYADFSEANFYEANFSFRDFENLDFSYADFSFARFNHANFNHTNFKNTNFQNANFQSSDFRNANFSYVDFTNANFTNAKFNFSLGDGIFIKTMLLKHKIVLVGNNLSIGFKTHTISEWKSFNDDAIEKMDNIIDNITLDWWKTHKDLIFKFCEIK